MKRHAAIARFLSPDSLYLDGSFTHEDLRIGSLVLRVQVSQPRFLDMLQELMRTRPLGAPCEPEPHTLHLTITEDVFRDQDELVERAQRALIDRPGEGPDGENLTEMRRDIARLVICETTPRRTDAVIELSCEERPDERSLSAIMISVYRILYFHGRVLLHAAAIGSGQGANLFLGEKGSGKTTTSFFLGRRGFPILAEDHVLLHRIEDEGADVPTYTVSGCDDRMRLTRKTELEFFEHGLDLPTTDVAGIPKKELDPQSLADLHWLPYRDVPVRRIFLPRVADAFAIEPIGSMQAVLQIVRSLQERFLFIDRNDRQRFLDFFSDFVDPLEVYRLTLSERIDDLDRLVDWFAERGESAGNGGAAEDGHATADGGSAGGGERP